MRPRSLFAVLRTAVEISRKSLSRRLWHLSSVLVPISSTSSTAFWCQVLAVLFGWPLGKICGCWSNGRSSCFSGWVDYVRISKGVKPRPHQQQCRSNVRLCRSIIRLCRKNCSTCSIWQCCFDIVAGVDGALVVCYHSCTIYDDCLISKLNSPVLSLKRMLGKNVSSAASVTSLRTQTAAHTAMEKSLRRPLTKILESLPYWVCHQQKEALLCRLM